MQKDAQKKGKISFIQEARREQIIQAAIETSGEIGYVKASLSKIAEKAGFLMIFSATKKRISFKRS